MDIGKIVQALVDRPLQSEENHSLINRRKEIRSLELLIKYQPFGIFGISGETGIGKTTVLNVLDSGDIKKLSVSLIHRDNRKRFFTTCFSACPTSSKRTLSIK